MIIGDAPLNAPLFPKKLKELVDEVKRGAMKIIGLTLIDNCCGEPPCKASQDWSDRFIRVMLCALAGVLFAMGRLVSLNSFGIEGKARTIRYGQND